MTIEHWKLVATLVGAILGGGAFLALLDKYWLAPRAERSRHMRSITEDISKEARRVLTGIEREDPVLCNTHDLYARLYLLPRSLQDEARSLVELVEHAEHVTDEQVMRNTGFALTPETRRRRLGLPNAPERVVGYEDAAAKLRAALRHWETTVDTHPWPWVDRTR